MTKRIDTLDQDEAVLSAIVHDWVGLLRKLRSIDDINKYRGIAGTCCTVFNTLRARRMELRGTEPETGIAGSAVRRYATEFAASGRSRRTADPGSSISLDDGGGGGDESGGDPDINVLDAG
jgi:hypothetical protein